MRYLFALLLALSLDAAYLYQNLNLCVDDYYFDQSTRKLYFLRSDKTSYQSTTNKNQIFVPGYDYNATTKTCVPKPILRQLQITNDQYYFLIALVAVLTGFVFLFFSVYLAAEVARK